MSLIQTTVELCAYQILQYKTLLLFVVVLCLVGFMKYRNTRNLPPGPWGLPVLGLLPFLSTQKLHIQLDGLRKKYGNVFGFYLGSKYVVFIGDLTKSKEAYNMEVFNARPEGGAPMSDKLKHFSVLHGQPWKARRKVAVQALRQLSVGTKMIQVVTKDQIKIAVQKFKKILSSKADENINVREIVTHTTTSVVLYFVCGKTFSSEHPNYIIVDTFLKFFAEKAASLNVDFVMPWTKPFLSTLTRYGKDTGKAFHDMEIFIRREIESHIQNCSEAPKDLIDFYVKHYKDQGVAEMPIDDINGDAQVMIFGGADTVRATIEWFLLCMAEHQEIQKKVFEEINSVLGPYAELCYEDKERLPYTEAAILECFRYKCIAPLSPYHSSLKDVVFCGYNIPKDSFVFSLLWTIHNDPAHWSHPQEYYPEHFLTPDKSAVQIPDAFIPFSTGKRTCVGEKVALIESFLFSASIIQCFHIIPPDGGTNMEGNLRVTMEARHPVIKLMKRHV